MMRIVAAMLFILSLAGCDGFVGEVSLPIPVGPRIAVVNPDYLVLRPVTKNATAGAESGVVYGQTLYFQRSDRLLDLSHFDLRTAALAEHFGPSSGDTCPISVSTTPAGSQALHQWTSAHVGQQLGIFLDGRLIAAPFIESPLSDMIVVDGDFTKPEAEAVLGRLRQGGASSVAR